METQNIFGKSLYLNGLFDNSKMCEINRIIDELCMRRVDSINHSDIAIYGESNRTYSNIDKIIVVNFEEFVSLATTSLSQIEMYDSSNSTF